MLFGVRGVCGPSDATHRALVPAPWVSEPWWVASGPVQQARQHHSKLPR